MESCPVCLEAGPEGSRVVRVDALLDGERAGDVWRRDPALCAACREWLEAGAPEGFGSELLGFAVDE